MPDTAQIARIGAVVVGAAVVPVLWFLGFAGGGKYDEHVARWEIDISAFEDRDYLFVRDSITVDFGNEHRSSLERVIDHGLGTPDKVYGQPWFIVLVDKLPEPGTSEQIKFSEQQVERSDGSTIAHLRAQFGRSTGVQHIIGRYGLPDVPQIGERFEYELITAGRNLDTSEVFVYLDGMSLASPTCRRGSGVPCELRETDGYYVVQFESLPADDSLTIGGTVTGWTDTVERPYQERIEARRAPGDERWLLWFLAVPFAAAGFELPRWAWRRRNKARWQVAVPAVPRLDGEPAPALAALPPLSPWTGTALLRQELGLPAAAAWFAEQVAAGVLTVDRVNGAAIFRRGPNFDLADLGMRDELARMFDRHDKVWMEPYLRPMKRVVGVVRRREGAALQAHQWWRRFAPGSGEWFSPEVACVFAVWAVVLTALISTNWSYSWPVAIALLVVVPMSTNAAVGWWMVPQLGIEGEEAVAAMAPLQQMLRGADTSHVEAAHRAGLLPQYSAWAVAFNAANRWRDAVRAADLPAEAVEAALAPLEMGRNGGPWSIAVEMPSNELLPPLRPEPSDA